MTSTDTFSTPDWVELLNCVFMIVTECMLGYE